MLIEVPGAMPEQTPAAVSGVTPTIPNPTPAAPTVPGVTPDTAARIRQLETDLANANAHVETLKTENIQRRKDSKITEEDRAELAAFRALDANGAKPEAVKAQLEAAATATQRAAALEREKLQATAAGILGLKPSALSAKWLEGGAPVIEGEGAEAKVFIQTGETKVSWEDFVKTNGELSDVLPALKADGQGSSTGELRVTPQPAGGNRDNKAFDVKAAQDAQAIVTRQGF